MDWTKQQEASPAGKATDTATVPQPKQTTIMDSMFTKTTRFDASVPVVKNVRNVVINRGIDMAKRKIISYRLRELLTIHFQTSYRDVCVSDVRDNPEGGFIIEKRDGCLVEETVVGGVMNVIERFLTLAEGDKKITSIYMTPPSLGSGMPRSNAPKKKSATEAGLRLHQLLFHKVECERELKQFIQQRKRNYTEIDTSFSSLSSSFDQAHCQCQTFLPGDGWTETEVNTVDSMIKYIEENLDLTLVASEMFLWHPVRKIGTRIDLICIDSALRYVVISIKTGRFGRHPNFGETTFHFRPPFHQIKDSIKYRHDLQLLIEILLLTEVYQMDISDAFILYSHANEARCLTVRRPEEMARELGTTPAGLLNLLSIGLDQNPPRVRDC